MNNINMDSAANFINEAKANPHLTKKTKRVDGEWNLTEGSPQFHAMLAYQEGSQKVEADFAPFMGGHGLAPDPLQYCLYGLASCYAGTFMAVASMEGVEIKSLRISAENKVDLSRTLGLSDRPIVEGVEIKINVISDASLAKLETIETMAKDRCPGVYCLTNPIKLSTHMEKGLHQDEISKEI